MSRILLAVSACLTVIAIGLPEPAAAQSLIKQSQMEREGDLQISKGIGLGTNGFQSHTDIKLVNELGLAYDMFSLLSRPEVRNTIGMEDTQYAELSQMHSELVAEVEAKLVDLIVSDSKELIEARFYEVESQLNDRLTSSQVEQVNQIMIQEGIANFGVQKMLSTSHLQEQLGLTDEDLQAIPGQTAAIATTKTESFAKANERLIKELSDEQASQLESCFEDFDADFMAAPLFDGNNHKPYSERVKQNSLWQAIRNRKLREHLELTEEQVEELNHQRRNAGKDSDAAAFIEDVLTEEQSREFQRVVVARQTERWGTTRALANGYLSTLLDVDEQQSEELIELGQQLHRELEQDIRVAKFEGWLGQLDSLPRSKREKVRKLIGEQIDLVK